MPLVLLVSCGITIHSLRTLHLLASPRLFTFAQLHVIFNVVDFAFVTVFMLLTVSVFLVLLTLALLSII